MNKKKKSHINLTEDKLDSLWLDGKFIDSLNINESLIVPQVVRGLHTFRYLSNSQISLDAKIELKAPTDSVRLIVNLSGKISLSD